MEPANHSDSPPTVLQGIRIDADGLHVSWRTLLAIWSFFRGLADNLQGRLDQALTHSAASKELEASTRLQKRIRYREAAGVASRCRRIMRSSGRKQREALGILSNSLCMSVSEMESLVTWHNRRREKVIWNRRKSILLTMHDQGHSKRKMGERLNVQPQHAGRLLERALQEHKEGLTK